MRCKRRKRVSQGSGLRFDHPTDREILIPSVQPQPDLPSGDVGASIQRLCQFIPHNRDRLGRIRLSRG